MPNPATLLSILALGALAACTPGAPAAPQTAANDPTPPSQAFHCPNPGTKATFRPRARPVTYNGADPADPMICLVANPNGPPSRRVANYLVPSPAQERAIRDGIAPLFPLLPGKTARFGYIQPYANDRTQTGQFTEEWTVIGPETLQIGGKPVQTIVVTRDVENNQSWGSNGYTWRLWFAPDTGVWVKGEPKLLRGSVTGLRPFMAVTLVAP